ncbi:GIY-YIG nuclease family protein [Lacinutrix jangbogonensis]
MHKSHMYFMCNKNNTTIYVGSSTNLIKRVEPIQNKSF